VFKRSILASFLLTLSAQSLANCGKHRDDLQYRNLNWVQAAVYVVNSPYADVKGALCAGTKNDRLERVHYRDTQGTKVYKTRQELKQRDVKFFGQGDFPAAARWVMRSDDALTLKIVEEKKSYNGSYNYKLSAKFLRNPRKGFSSSDVRELVLDYSTDYNETFYKDALIDGIHLNITSGLRIDEVLLIKGRRKVLSLSPYRLPSARRD